MGILYYLLIYFLIILMVIVASIPFFMFTMAYDKKNGIKNGIGKTTKKCFCIILGVFLTCNVLYQVCKVRKGDTVQESTINFLGMYDQKYPLKNGVSGMKKIKEGTYSITYNFQPFLADTYEEINREISLDLTDNLKRLFRADKRIKSMAIFINIPIVSNNRNEHFIWKQYVTFGVDREVLNCIDNEIRLRSELIRWSKSINEI